jgi:hypothetical protein
VFAEGGVVEDEVRAGLFDGAEIRISFVDWQNPDGHGEIRLRRGTLGETRLTPQGYFHAELRGLSQPLAQSTLEVFSPNSPAAVHLSPAAVHLSPAAVHLSALRMSLWCSDHCSWRLH